MAGGGDGGPRLRSYIDIRTDRTLPAFSRCSLDSNLGNGEAKDGDPAGQFNMYLRWRTDDSVDEPDRWEMTAYLIGAAPKDACRVDVTPRRCRKFRPKPGERFAWTAGPAADASSPEAPAAAAEAQAARSGQADADKWGLLTLGQVTVTGKGTRIAIRRR